jgi:hypothetical protein
MILDHSCTKCKNYIRKTECAAFAAIPEEIWLGEHDHRQPYPGDNGIRFEPVKPETDDNQN